MNQVTIRLELEVSPEMPGAEGVEEPSRWLRFQRSLGIHAGVRALGPYQLAARESDLTDLDKHWRTFEFNNLLPGSMCLLVLLFDRYKWEGQEAFVWQDTDRRFCAWLTRPELELHPPSRAVIPGLGITETRTHLYLKTTTIEDVNLDAGELGTVGFPDMMQLFYLGDMAVLGFRPGLEDIQLMVAQVSSERLDSDTYATTEHHAYLIELKPTPTDMVTTWQPPS